MALRPVLTAVPLVVWSWLLGQQSWTCNAAAASLDPTQARIMAEVRHAAVNASLMAEREILEHVGTASFRAALMIEGAHELLSLSAEQLLQTLKENLESIEYINNFGLDEESLKKNPGQGAMDVHTIEAWGHIPSDWELRHNKSTLVANVNPKQWGIYDAAETGLYPLPEFKNLHAPTLAEIQQRPKYLAGNLRRLDAGLLRYGAMSAVVRNQVVLERAVFLPADSGGWESMCNASVDPVVKASVFEKLLIPCKEIFAGGDGRPVLGVADHQLHTVLANAKVFGRVGGHLARQLHQFLSPTASVRPIEGNMYTEQILFGPLRPSDLKLLVGNFPGLFGSVEGEALRSFCRKHKVPLAWALGAGRMWPDEAMRPMELWPFQPFYDWAAGRARLLDPLAGWPSTNASSIAPIDKNRVWDAVWKEVVEARSGDTELRKKDFTHWWNRLEQATGSVSPLRGRDCASSDLCFGTFERPSGVKDCVCRAVTTKDSHFPIMI